MTGLDDEGLRERIKMDPTGLLVRINLFEELALHCQKLEEAAEKSSNPQYEAAAKRYAQDYERFVGMPLRDRVKVKRELHSQLGLPARD